MTSVSSGGGSVITLEFNLDEDIDVAEQEVQAAINAANSFLPTDLPNPPVYSKVNPADAPIMTLALTSDSLPLDKVEDSADTNLAQKISQVTGVGLVSIAGGQKPSVRVQANPAQLAAYNLSLEDLRTALAAANVDQAKGTLNGSRLSYTINDNDQLDLQRRLPPRHRRLPKRRPRPHVRCRERRRCPRELAAGGMDEPPAGRDRQRAAPARRQHHCCRGPHQQAASSTADKPPGQRQGPRPYRPNHHHSRIGERCRIRADAHRGIGRHGHLSLPAQPRRHHHSIRRGASLHCRHFRRDVPAGLLTQQPHPDGADHFHRIRSRRRHRDDREHLALH